VPSRGSGATAPTNRESVNGTSNMTNSGGNRHVITKESWARDRKYLKRKWGEYLQEKDSGGVMRMVVSNVARRQKLSL